MMHILPGSPGFLAAMALAGIMGFAIQRGATCTVAAVHEIVEKRRPRRLLAMVEASVWVGGGLALAASLQLPGSMPAGYPVTGFTVLGGILLGLGAFVNRACVFGAIARLGSGQWAYALTPPGFYAGCLTVDTVFQAPQFQTLPYGSLVLRSPHWLALAFAAFALWRLAKALRALRDESRQSGLPTMLARRVWSPHAATMIIGISFLFMLLLAGAWAYTDVLTDLARSMMAASLAARGLLLAALLLGAILGGWTAGLIRSTRVTAAGLLSCFAGGMLMGWGSLLIPGGNDGLVLVGMPLLWPYAWLAFTTMCIAIGLAMLAQKAFAHPAGRRA
ncbi:MAG: YeeE/YedE thiosulfate transporter family protein [Noviherbaspirillum sp.]